MTGHATSKEIQELNKLKDNLDVEKSPIEDLLKVGQIYIEPFHEEEKAIELFEIILKRDPANFWAKYWLADCCIRYLMEKPNLQRAVDLLESCLSDSTARKGAAYQLLAEARSDLGNISKQEEIQLLEGSVKLESAWTSNRMYLASLYESVGRIEDAIEQVEQALNNTIDVNPDWNIIEYNFETNVTGRAKSDGLKQVYGDKLAKLKEMKAKSSSPFLGKIYRMWHRRSK